jgi:hypothetical protein
LPEGYGSCLALGSLILIASVLLAAFAGAVIVMVVVRAIPGTGG